MTLMKNLIKKLNERVWGQKTNNHKTKEKQTKLKAELRVNTPNLTLNVEDAPPERVALMFTEQALPRWGWPSPHRKWIVAFHIGNHLHSFP